MAVTITRGLDLIYEKIQPVSKEIIPIENALGCVLAQTINAHLSLPSHNNSAMDGFAIKACEQQQRLRISQTLLAGEDKKLTLEKGEAIRIMTGANIPKGADTVVPIEDVVIEGETVTIQRAFKEGANIRLKGEDIEEQTTLLTQGDRLNSYKIALLASQGISHIEVYKKPKVTIIASGKELKMYYERLEDEAHIYNTNTPMLYLRTKELHCEVAMLEASDDNLASMKEVISTSLDSDLILTTGGASVGDADFTKQAFSELGSKNIFDKVLIKPGKPTSFSKLGSTFVLNLAGNPLAGALNFEIFGTAIINALSGTTQKYHATLKLLNAEAINNKKGRDTVVAGYIDEGKFQALEKRAPNMVSTMAQSDGFIILNSESEGVQKDEMVDFIGLTHFSKKRFL